MLDVLVQSRRGTRAAKRLMRKLLKNQGYAPRVLVTDKLRSYGAASRAMGLTFKRRIRTSRSKAKRATRSQALLAWAHTARPFSNGLRAA